MQLQKIGFRGFVRVALRFRGFGSVSGLSEQFPDRALDLSGKARISAAGLDRGLASVVVPSVSVVSASERLAESATVLTGSASALAESVSSPVVSAKEVSAVSVSDLAASASVLVEQSSGSDGSGFAFAADKGSDVVTVGNDKVSVSVPLHMEGSKQSYLAAVQKKAALSKHDLSIVSDEGGQFFQVPDDILQDVNHLWDDLIIGKFPEDSPHIAKVHVIVNKIWTYGNKQVRIDAFVVNKTTIKFRIKDPVIRDRVLRRGMWNIADKPMMVSKYGPVAEEDQSALRTMSLWVSISQIPPSFSHGKG